MGKTNAGGQQNRALELGRHFATAVSHYQAGRPAEAEAACRLVLNLAPMHDEALHLCGVAAAQQGKFADAVDSFRKALRLRPDHAELLCNLGGALRKQGEPVEAIECFKQALRLKPEFAEAAFNCALALHDSGQAEAVAAQLADALRLRPAYPEALCCLGQVLQEQGRFEEAIGRYREALGLRPHYLEALFCLGAIYARVNRVAEAQVQLEQYLALEPEDKQGARLVLARLGLAPLPERASAAQLSRIYQQRTHAWDKGGAYFGHELVARAFVLACAGSIDLDILDAGCGSGLIGPLIRNVARRLDGVDLSAPMLESARRKAVYANLYEDDLLAFMSGRPDCYDAVLSAATLIHFGDLTAPFRAVAKTLRSGGLFVFTVFPNEEVSGTHGVTAAPLDGYCEGGCFLHGPDYVRSLAEGNGFAVVSMATEVHEHFKGREKAGLVVVCRRW